MFKVEFIGNLGADAEVKDVNGNKFVSFRVAHVDKWTGDDGQSHESTEWADCTYNNVDSKVIQYLKVGVKVYVRGNGALRVYSSAKEKKMKAGIRISVTEIELCGGVAELVPRQLVDPDNGQLVDVTKYYWANADTKKMKATETKEYIDIRGNRYIMNKQGFVIPIPKNDENATGTQSDEKKEEGNQ